MRRTIRTHNRPFISWNSWSLPALARSIILASALLVPVSAGASDDDVLLTDGSDFPLQRLYLEVPGPSWAQGSAEVTFVEGVETELVEGLEYLDERVEEAEAESVELEAPERPDTPETSVPAELFEFDEQANPTEGLLVVLLVDTSGSMDQTGRGDAAPSSVARRHVEILVSSLRPVDRVALVAFGDDIRVVVAPTTERQRVLRAMSSLPFDEEVTHIYDAIVATLQDVVRPEMTPQLPGRRMLVVFSDGRDEDSAHPAGDIPAILNTLPDPPTIFTVGLGNSGRADDRFRDLQRVASFAGNRDNFLETPQPSDLVATFESATERLGAQLMVEFEVPLYYQRTGTHQATLALYPPSDPTREIQISFDVETLSAEQEQAHSDYVAALEAVGAWKVEQEVEVDQRRTWLIYGGAAGVLLLVGILLVVAGRRKRRREFAEHEAEREAQQAALEEVQSTLEQKIGAQQADVLQQAEKRAEKRARQTADTTRTALGVLLGMDGPLKGQRYGVLKASCVLGRDTDRCDLVFPSTNGDPAISRVHAKFTLGSGQWVATNLSDGVFTVNGNGLRKSEEYPVQFGDQLGIGKTVFKFEQP